MKERPEWALFLCAALARVAAALDSDGITGDGPDGVFMELSDEEYQQEYDKASAELDAAEKSTTARSPDGKFANAEPAPEPKAQEPAEPKQETPEPKAETPAEPKDEPKQDDDELATLRKRFEAQEKALKDTQAWATKLSQERAAEKREAERRAREASKPSILDANPELADAIRHVVNDKPQEQEPDPKQIWAAQVERAHPGIFSAELDKDLETDLATRLTALSDEDRADPLIAIREITAGKLAFEERKAAKRLEAETAKAKQKAAMSVPGAGAGGSRTASDPDMADVHRVQNLSDADFEREYRKARGF